MLLYFLFSFSFLYIDLFTIPTSCFQQIRPIDKKLQYQIQKLTKVTVGVTDDGERGEKESDISQKTEDLLTYRPNPDMLVSKADESSKVVCISH